MFTASANYYRDNGMYIEDTYTKYGGNFAVEHKVLENLRLKASANLTASKRHNNGYLSYNRNPIFPVYNEDGSYWQYSVQDYYYPLALTNLQKDETAGTNPISYFAASRTESGASRTAGPCFRAKIIFRVVAGNTTP